ncbi:MAG: 2,4-dihydroxyhept-2-ene-1,7-dioic acid aldolase [Rhodospirillales bacterium]|nr:2,4-dihydroxyhept-2-ene-1,7-dioic acid aldolase [Rhodospirillales bacterium]
MRENRIRKNWSQDKAVLCGWLAIPSSFSAEVIANEDLDAVLVDTQHGMIEVQMAITMLQAISTKGPAPMVRVNWNDPAPIMKLLDAGAYGVICPMINSREECERFVKACRYPPDGYRSFGPARGLLYGGPDYFEHANASVVTMAMIETREAMGRLDEIMSTKGLDGVYIGPSDLSIGLGHPPTLDPTAKEVLDAIDLIYKTARKHNIVPGIHTPGGKVAKKWIDKGFRLCALSNDARLLAAQVKSEIAAARG